MFKWGAWGSMNRESLSQSTDNHSPLLMSMDCPQHSGELTHSSPDRRKCKQHSLHERWFPDEVPEKNQGEVVWEGSSSACPRDDITIILLFFSHLKMTNGPVESYCKNVLWEPKITRDMKLNVATLAFPSLFIPNATRVLPGEFKMILPSFFSSHFIF